MKKTVKKLVLAKETVQRMELAQVQGAAPATGAFSCGPSCFPKCPDEPGY